MRTQPLANPPRPHAGLLALALATTACFAPSGKDSTSTGSSTGAATGTSDPNPTTTTTPTTDPNPTTTTPSPTTDETATTTSTTASDTDTTAGTDPMTTTGSTTETDTLCGNGELDGTEACDDGDNNANNAPCTKLCQVNICGDKLPCAACNNPVQECDDGNLLNGDGCSDTCAIEVRYIFVTKANYMGQELGGIIGADAKCMQAAAAAANLSPLLKNRKFRAWLSTSNIDAKTHVGDDMKPVLRTDGMQVAPNTPSLASGGKLAMPIDRNEFGDQVAPFAQCINKGNLVWTGTLADGAAADDLCANWSISGVDGLMGGFSETDPTWTDCEVFTCATLGHLYCLEVPNL